MVEAAMEGVVKGEVVKEAAAGLADSVVAVEAAGLAEVAEVGWVVGKEETTQKKNSSPRSPTGAGAAAAATREPSPRSPWRL